MSTTKDYIAKPLKKLLSYKGSMFFYDCYRDMINEIEYVNMSDGTVTALVDILTSDSSEEEIKQDYIKLDLLFKTKREAVAFRDFIYNQALDITLGEKEDANRTLKKFTVTLRVLATKELKRYRAMFNESYKA